MCVYMCLYVYLCVCMCLCNAQVTILDFFCTSISIFWNEFFDYVCMYFNVPATFPLIQRERHERSSDCAVVAGRESVFVKVNGY